MFLRIDKFNVKYDNFLLLNRVSMQEMCPMPDSNLVKSITSLMDCFLEDFREKMEDDATESVKLSDLDLRAQIEVCLKRTFCFLKKHLY